MLLPVVAGCTVLGGENAGTAASAAPPVPTDPIAAFAAQAGPGQRGTVLLTDGRPAQLEMTRSYYAASGRECREVLVGSGMGQRVQLVCASDGGGWAVARPLLPGGGVPRR